MLIGESESLYNCKMHDLSSFSQRYHFLNRLLAALLRPDGLEFVNFKRIEMDYRIGSH